MRINKKSNYLIIGKCLFFPYDGLLVVGDMHIGYDKMLGNEGGVMFPMDQVKEVIAEFRRLFKAVVDRDLCVKKVVLLGDIKHYFGYKKQEKYDLLKVINFLKRKVGVKNVVLVRGNHDKIDFGLEVRDYYIDSDIGVGFIHGNKIYEEIIKEKEVKIVVMAHFHPCVVLKDMEGGVKKEKFKCFLIGRWKKKELVVVPSFLSYAKGGFVNRYDEKKGIVNKKDLLKLKVCIVNDNLNEEALCFGKLSEFD
jgi:uncharacterized protein